jgi:hypothetical protein
MNEEVIWAYIAGLIDGEGYMAIFLHTAPSLRKCGKGYARDFKFTISNTSLSLLESVKAKIEKITGFKGDIVEHKHKNNLHRSCYSLRYYQNALRVILPKVIPYLILKKQAAEIMVAELEIIKTLPSSSKRDAILFLKDKEFKDAYPATYGHIPPCRSEYNIAFINRLKHQQSLSI